MKTLFEKNKMAKAFQIILSFILALCISACALCSFVKLTLFSRDFLTDSVNNSGYYADLCDEITEKLIDLGDASGLNKSFFKGFLNEVLVRQGVQDYIDSFYSGSKLTVNTEHFESELREALETYVKKRGLGENDYNKQSLDYFVKEAVKVFSDSIKISYLSGLQKAMIRYDKTFTVASIISGAVSAAILLVMFLTNKRKYRVFRYAFYSFAGSGLFILMIPSAVFASGIIGRITIITKSLNDLYTSYLTSFFSMLFIVAGLMLVISAVSLLVHFKLRQNALD